MEENKEKKTEEEVKEKMEKIRDENVEQNLNQRLDSTPKNFNEDRPKYLILEKTKALYTMLHSYLNLFPKSEKFTLRQKIEEGILECIRLLILQNYQQTDDERSKLILKFLSEIYLIEVLLYQSVVFKYVSYDGYNKIIPLVREINTFALARYKNLNKKMDVENENF